MPLAILGLHGSRRSAGPRTRPSTPHRASAELLGVHTSWPTSGCPHCTRIQSRIFARAGDSGLVFICLGVTAAALGFPTAYDSAENWRLTCALSSTVSMPTSICAVTLCSSPYHPCSVHTHTYTRVHAHIQVSAHTVQRQKERKEVPSC